RIPLGCRPCARASRSLLCAAVWAVLKSIVSTMANNVFQALAHPKRRDIGERLSGGATTVSEASGDLGVSKPTISRHLKMLEEAGVVTRVIDGRTHRLALRPETLAHASDWID